MFRAISRPNLFGQESVCRLPGRMVLTAVVAAILGSTESFSNQAFSATPLAGKTPQKVFATDWKIEIVPGPAIGASPIPAKKAALKLAKAQDDASAPEAVPPKLDELPKQDVPTKPEPEATPATVEVTPTDEIVKPKSPKKLAPAKPKLKVTSKPADAEAAQPDDTTQPAPVVVPAGDSAEAAPQESAIQVIPGSCEGPDRLPINRSSYAEIYNSIPFSRAEYFANPAYRHEATMEIMMGQLRARTVVQMSVPMTQTTHGFAQPFRFFHHIQQDIRHRGFYSPYAY